jgi:cytochrome bd ubiquinol oxidase subunit II
VSLQTIPMVLALVGVALYAVLGGADFGAGFWQLAAGPGERGARIREHAHDAMAAVWEANHVWLIFVLVMLWTCYPTAFASIVSTLAVPLFIAALGIVLRGTAYALRAGASRARGLRSLDSAFGFASILTPFALGTVAGAIAAGRVPVGNAAGSMWSSWTGAVPLTIGVLAVVVSAYLAAVYLAADAVRRDQPDMERAFRSRALAAGAVAGAAAVGGLIVLHDDAHSLYHALVAGDGLPALIVSALAGLGTLALVFARRYEAARYSAALAVAAVVAGWASAQEPELLPGLTVKAAAAPHDTLVAVLVAFCAGAVLLGPSLWLLFSLSVRGKLAYGGPEGDGAGAGVPIQALGSSRNALLARVALACLVLTLGFLTAADAGWAHAVGVAAMFTGIAAGFRAAVLPTETAP